MALNNYSALQTAVADWLNRTDLTAAIPDFITLAEAKIKRRVRRKTVRATFNVTAEATTLPADCQELRTAYPVSGSPSADFPLSIGTPPMLADIRAMTNGVPGRPQIVAVVDGSLIVAPAPSTVPFPLQITYFQNLVPLSGGAPVNATLTEAPDIYLYGALCEAAAYLDHDERIATWQTRFDDSIDALNLARQGEETNMSLRAARLPVVFG